MAVTVRASTNGLDEVDRARRRKGWLKSEQAWADLACVSVQTLKRFWSGVPIRVEAFKSICKEVEIIDWELIADFGIINESSTNGCEKRVAFAIAGSIEEIDKHKLDAIVTLLQNLSGDTTIAIVDIDTGSIKLILSGSSEALEKIESLFKSGELSEELRDLVLDVHLLEKNEQVLLLQKHGGAALNLSKTNLSKANLTGTDLSGANLCEANLRGTNLSRTNLSEANLSRANLIEANLSRADLSGTDLSGARFGRNLGLTELDKFNMRERGAIFEEPPNFVKLNSAPRKVDLISSSTSALKNLNWDGLAWEAAVVDMLASVTYIIERIITQRRVERYCCEQDIKQEILLKFKELIDAGSITYVMISTEITFSSVNQKGESKPILSLRGYILKMCVREISNIAKKNAYIDPGVVDIEEYDYSLTRERMDSANEFIQISDWIRSQVNEVDFRILELHYLHGLRSHEISLKLSEEGYGSISTANVRQRKRRVFQLLRNTYEQET